MPVTLQAKGAPVRLRDGPDGAQRLVGADPVTFDHLDAAQFENDNDVEIVGSGGESSLYERVARLEREVAELTKKRRTKR